MINASHDTSTPRPWWATLTSLRAAAAPRIGLATLVMLGYAADSIGDDRIIYASDYLAVA